MLYRLSCISAILFFFAACQPGTPGQQNKDSIPPGMTTPSTTTDTSTPVTGSYQGTLPCADCPGIDYQISLYEDSTYQAITSYQGRGNNIAETTTGKWTQAADTILVQDGKTLRRFLAAPHQLTQLDGEGQVITGALASYYILKHVEGGGNRAYLQEKARTGVSFVANGNEPGWSLEINKKQLVFRTMNGDSLLTPLPVAHPNTDTLKTYASGKLKVSIRNTMCMDDMSGFMYPFTVEVEANDKTFRGCGQYIK